MPSKHGQPKFSAIPSFGTWRRLISSSVPQPTSENHSSSVPGRGVIRHGLRMPYATIRRAFASGEVSNGLPGQPAPVSGSIRMIVPSSPVGSPVVRTSWERSAPPSEPGRVSAVPAAPGGSPHGFGGTPFWPQSAAL